MSPAGCIIGGQPARLAQLMEGSIFFQNSSIQSDSLCGLYSSALVYGETEVQEILGTKHDRMKPVLPPSWPLLSPVDGREITGSDTFEMVKQAVESMLQRPVRWHALLDSAVHHANEMKDFDGKILVSGSALAANSFASALASGVQMRTAVESLTSWPNEVLRKRLKGSDIKSKIAVIGMSTRLSPDLNAEQLWETADGERGTNASERQNGIEMNPCMAKKGLRYNHGPFGSCIADSELLDPRHAITTAYEALEMSGFVPNRTPSTQLDRVGTFYSQTSDDWRALEMTEVRLIQAPTRAHAFTPGRVSHYFNFGGPSHSVDTACTSSLAAIHTACKSLQSRECDTAVIGGLDVSSPSNRSGQRKALSPVASNDSSLSQNFDGEGSGYAKAEGVATIVMKRLEDAQADQDNIMGLILGSATNHSGDSTSARRPYAGSQSYLYQKILRGAGIDPSQVDYCETQGPTTPTDTIKTTSKSSRSSTPQETNLTKPATGQTAGTFGVTALVSMLLRMRREENQVESALIALSRSDKPDILKTSNLAATRKPRLAFLTRVSVSRGNTALLLQGQAESNVSLRADSHPSYTIVLSANTTSSLKKNLRNMLRYIETNPNVSLSSVAYTTTARRVHHRYREAFSVSNKEELQQQLAAKLEGSEFNLVPSSPPKVAFIFTGQGAFYPRLANQLFEVSTQFRADINYLNDLAVHQGLPSFLPAITGTVAEGKNTPPLVQQLALACVQMALVKLWRSWGIEPTMVVGQSLGEYAALNAAGVISVDHTIHLVGQRGKILQAACDVGTHGMLAVRAGVPEISSCATRSETAFEVECLNSPTDTVIGGTKAAMESIATELKTSGLKCRQVDLPYAFHSAQVEPVLDPYKHVADGVVYESPKITVISSLLGRVVNKGGVFDAEYCRRHTREPVNLIGAVQAAGSKGIIDADTVCIEIGPHPVCSPCVTSILGTKDMVMAPSLRRNEDPWRTLCCSLGALHGSGLEIDWGEVHRDSEGTCRLVELPASAFGFEDCEVEYPVTSLTVPFLDGDFGDDDEEEEDHSSSGR